MSYSLVAQQLRERACAPIPLDQPIPIERLPTPALVLNRAALMRNIERMRQHLQDAQKGFRPHAKTHKCPIICRLQLEAGAVGVCVAKPSEALVMAAAGIEPILITSPVATPDKAAVVAEIAAQGVDLAIVVDSPVALDVLRTALAQDARLGVLIDFDVGMGRTGTRDDGIVLQLLESINADDRLSFRGVQHYAGHVMHVEGHAQRRERSLALWEAVAQRIEALAEKGFDCEIVTGGGTGTYDIDTEVSCLTDLQVGSYVFMDEEYRQIGSRTEDRFVDFEVALTVACTTISQPLSGAMTVDAGFKSMASDTVPAAVDELADTKFRFAGDEHGVLLSKQSMQSLRLGQVVQLVTPHCDPTVNLHDYYWVQEEDGLIHSCWPVSARGCTW